ncbi:uncharacterized protein EV154DRAFT_494113 [Mucor mucedo]|uniref:uncharacterized protein n=1 Tax=Mucor mucedo TaxID=29922 RepID=UPI00221E52CF|nr:uncharacterized protein EV154DRAFT_494113 [Mucor mucedo]KAI7895899.1 hypothetical protein EV154DRAFT_494113 [Mucor mucedo]
MKLSFVCIFHAFYKEFHSQCSLSSIIFGLYDMPRVTSHKEKLVTGSPGDLCIAILACMRLFDKLNLFGLFTPRRKGGRVRPSSETMFKAPFWSRFDVVDLLYTRLGQFLLTQTTAPFILFMESPLLSTCLVVGSKHEVQVIVDLYSSTVINLSFSIFRSSAITGFMLLLLWPFINVVTPDQFPKNDHMTLLFLLPKDETSFLLCRLKNT